ncbi:MAG: tetratricopeptide repeat protein [Bryobacterales bacterium]|nr:tetratricopeptide repeat protein [Bryobacterales bacterium]
MLNEIGLIEFELARFASADRTLRRGIAILERTGEAPVALAKLCSSLASLLTDLNLQLGYAEMLRRRALRITVQELGPEHPEIRTLLGNLGTTLMARRNYQEARHLFEKARAMLGQTAGERLTRASLTSNLGVVASLTGRPAEAAGHFREAIAIWDGLVGPLHPDLVRPCLNLARVYLQLGKPELAWEMTERARAAAARSLPENHPTSLEVLRAGVAAAKKSGRKAQASALQRRLRSITPMDASPVGLHVDVSDLRPE